MFAIPLAFQPYIFLGIIFLMFLAIYRSWVKPSTCFLFVTILLIITGILSPEEAIRGLSNTSIISVLLLILITAGIKNNFNLEVYIYRLFDKAKGPKTFLLLLMSKVAILSSFVNNTPVVALMTPYVINWGKKNKISPSQLLIPLSFATIVGGMITIIGTSTTLVLNGFVLDVGQEGLHNTDFLLIGIPLTIIIILFLAFFSKGLLPNKKDIIDSFADNTREYLIEKRLQNNSPLIGKSVEDGGLRNMKGVYLVEIIRNNVSISPVSRKEVIQEKDILIFAGNTETILDISDENFGMDFPKQVVSMPGKMEVVEGIVSANSSLIGRSIKESKFRNRYDAAVVAVHRGGEHLVGKIGEIELKAGDVLLMYAGQDFDDRVELYKDILIISEERKSLPNESSKTRLYILIGLVLFLVVTQWFGLFTSLLIITATMVAMRMITVRTIKRDLDFDMIVILVLSIALGEAMISTGSGSLIAEYILSFLMPFGIIPVMAGLMLFTLILTSFISNVGAIAIVFPLAFSIANTLQIDPMPFYLTIAYGASAAFLTPIGYQTNLMVYGPGGYTFRDFLKIGIPVAVIYSAVALSLIILIYNRILIN